MPKATKRIEFTREMKKTHKLLFPNMAEIHFKILKNVLVSFGYDIDLLTTTGREIVDEGLKYVHNDTCYPALLTIGQMISALKSGKYDINKTALLMSQTGGGCRASNYIFLLRKALKKANMEQVPVVSVNVVGLEKNSGFKITLPLLRRALAAIVYGDILMLLANQTRPYEVHKGETDALVDGWVKTLSALFLKRRAIGRGQIKVYFEKIVSSFEKINIIKTPIPKVGIVGEIYVKYSPLGNNDLERFLREEGCEIMVPGILGFLQYTTEGTYNDINLYGGSKLKKSLFGIAMKYLSGFERYMIEAVQKSGKFISPKPFKEQRLLGEKFIGLGCKMGEGWLLTAEMAELTESGFENIVCAQPFGCLPNHIVGKGMIRTLKEHYPNSNIVAIDYDPGATKVNQENRIKLMLTVAREKINERNIFIDGEKTEYKRENMPIKEKVLTEI